MKTTLKTRRLQQQRSRGIELLNEERGHEKTTRGRSWKRQRN
jgi:hypothetical protein